MIALDALFVAGSVMLLMVAYFFYELAQEKRLEAATQHQPFVPPPDLPDDVKKTMTDADVLAGINAAKGMDQAQKSEWMVEKLEDGWTQEDVDKFLAERPILELN